MTIETSKTENKMEKSKKKKTNQKKELNILEM